MPKVTVAVEGPDGQHAVDIDAGTNGEAWQAVQAQGWKPLGFLRPEEVTGASATLPPPGPPTPESPEPTGMRRFLGPAAQIAVPAGLAALGVTNPALLAPAGFLAGMVGSGVARGGKPTGTDLLETAGAELVPPLARGAVRAGRAAFGPKALETGLAGAAERVGVPLPAPTLFGREGGMAGRVADTFATKGFQEAQMEGVTTGAPKELRRLFGSMRNPVYAANRVQQGVRGLVRAIPKEGRDAALATIKRDTGVNLLGNAKTILGDIQRDPGKVGVAVQALAKAAGRSPEAVTQRLGQTFFSDVLDKALVQPASGEKVAGGLHGAYLDGNVLAEAIAKVPESGKIIFGAARPEVEALAAVLSKASAAQQGLTRFGVRGGAATAGPEVGRFPLRPFGLALGLGLGGEAVGELSGMERGKGAERTLAGLGAGYLGAKGLAALLSSRAGVLWFGAGIDMLNRGLPERTITEALARGVPRVLMEVMQGETAETPARGTVQMPPAEAIGFTGTGGQ